MNSFATLGVMHELTQCVTLYMKRFYTKKVVGLTLLQVLKHCAARMDETLPCVLVTASDQTTENPDGHMNVN